MKFDSKLTFEDHVRRIIYSVSQRIGILRLVKHVFVDTSLLIRCYFEFVLPILEYCSPVWGSVAECQLQLLERQVYSVAKLCPDQSFLSMCHRLRVAKPSMLYKLIPTLITVCSASFHLLLLKFNILTLRSQLIHWNLKYQGVERPNLAGLCFRLRFDCGMSFPTMCLIQERWMGSRVQSTIGCFPDLCFLLFSVAQVLVLLRNKFINNLFFPTWACATRVAVCPL